MELRPARPGDEEAVADVHVLSWQVAYRGLIADEYLDRLSRSEHAARYTFGQGGPDDPRTTVAVDGEGICGFATTGPCRDPDRCAAGELYAIYVHPEWCGRGVGRMLIGAAAGRLVGQGFVQAVLWVLAGNERASRFYRIDGWQADGARRRQEIHGVTVDEVRYARSLTGPRIISPG